MPDLDTLIKRNPKTLEQLEKENSAGTPMTSQKEYSAKKAIGELNQEKSREQLTQENFAKTPEQLTRETHRNLVQSIPENERISANLNLRPELQVQAGEKDEGGAWDVLGGMRRTMIDPLVGLGKAALSDVSNLGDVATGKKESSLYETAIGGPARHTFEKAMDPNRSAPERFAHGVASFLPGGPILSDVGERLIPQFGYGTGKERKEALGEVGGVFATERLGKVVKSVRRAGSERRFGKAAAKLADSTGGELTQLEVEDALHLLDDQFKREFGTVGGKGSKEKPAIDLRHVNPEELKSLSEEALASYSDRNIKPIEGFLSKTMVNPFSVFKKALGSIGILEGEAHANLPPYAMEYAKSFLKDRPLGDLLQMRGELNGKMKATQGLSGLDFNNFIRQHPAGKFYSTLLDGLREMIDTTVDNNAGPYAGAMKGVLTDFAKLKTLSDGLSKGAERSAAIETARNAKTLTEKTPVVRGLFAGATKGRLGSAGTAGQLTGEAGGILGTPRHRIHQAGSMLERPGWGGLIPPGRRAMQPVPEVNWSPVLGGVTANNPLMPPPFSTGGSVPPNTSGGPPGWTPPQGPGAPPLPYPHLTKEPLESLVTPGSPSVNEILNITKENKTRKTAPTGEIIPEIAPRPEESRQVLPSEAIETTTERRVKSPVEPSEAVEKSVEKPPQENIPTIRPRARKYISVIEPSKKAPHETPAVTKTPVSELVAKSKAEIETAQKKAKTILAKIEPKKEINPEVVAKMKAKLKKTKETPKADLTEQLVKELTPEKKAVGGELTEVKSLGGSTGAKLYKNELGDQYVVKHGKTDAHTANEVEAAKLYRVLGVNTPPVEMKMVGGKNAAVSNFVEGSKKLGDIPDKAKHYKDISKDFVADALLGNWDSIGLDFDNILVTPQGKTMRIDPAGSLRFRAKGGIKQLGDTVGEIETLRNPGKNPQAAEVFKDLTDKDIAEQIQKILPKKMEFLKNVGEDLKSVMENRFDDLKKRLTQLQSAEAMKVKAPPTGTVKGNISGTPHFHIEALPGRKGSVIKDSAGKTHKTIDIPGDEGYLEAKKWLKKFSQKLQKTLSEED